MNVLDRLDKIGVLLCLLHNLCDFRLRDKEWEVFGDLALVNVTVTIHSCRTVSSFALFALYWELSVRVTLRVAHYDVKRGHALHLLNDWCDIIDNYVSILITLQKQKLPSFLVVERVYCCIGHFLLNTHIVKFGDELIELRVRLGGRGRAHDPDSDCPDRVRRQQQGIGLDEVHNLDFKFVDELVEQDDSLVVPHLHSTILTSCGNQAQVMTIGATDYILFVAVWLASLDHVAGGLVVHHFIHVHLDCSIPATCNNGVI